VSITAPAGFSASGIACGIKASGAPDLALVVTSDGKPVPAAGVFTTNKAAAAPVQVSRAHLQETGGRASGVIINSGNANAATGAQGKRHAWGMAAAVAHELGIESKAILVCSTGLIGIPLQFEPIQSGIGELVGRLGSDIGNAQQAARAILTTDTRAKQSEFRDNGFIIGGMAKGAAMLEPSMATMLAVLTTDAVATSEMLHCALQEAVASSFNQLIIDGATSTNDTVLVFASGASGHKVDEASLVVGLKTVCTDLAYQMANDAEGGTKVARITVKGAMDSVEALAGARKVASSLLVKCSLNGQDPYWGRIVSELGSAGIDFDIDLVSVSYGGVRVCSEGSAAPHDAAKVQLHMSGHDIDIEADLGLGDGEASVLATDISHAYIDENVRTS